MALYLKADGDMFVVEPEDGNHFTLDELQTYVDGYFELVRCDRYYYMVVNEDGHAKGLQPNILGTVIYRGVTIPNTHVIVGDVLICKQSQIE